MNQPLSIVAITTAVVGREKELRAAQEKLVAGRRNPHRARLPSLRIEPVTRRWPHAGLHRTMGKRA